LPGGFGLHLGHAEFGHDVMHYRARAGHDGSG
jgi:hypothetical protein